MVMLSSVEGEGKSKFPSHGQHLTAPKLDASSWIYWTTFKTGLRCCSRPSSIKCDPSKICTSETAEILQMVGQMCPYFKPRITLDLNNTSSGHALPATKTILQRQPTSLKIPKGWRGLGAMERTGEFPLQLLMRFQSCCTT